MNDEDKIERTIAGDYKKQLQERQEEYSPPSKDDLIDYFKSESSRTLNIVEALKTVWGGNDTFGVEQYLELIREAQLESDQDDIHTHLILKSICGDIEEACRELDLPLKAGVVWGSENISGVNASLTNVPLTRANVLTVTPMLPVFFSLISKAISSLLDFDSVDDDGGFVVNYDPERVIEKLKEDLSLQRYWVLAILSVTKFGHVSFVPELNLIGAVGRVRLEVLRSMEIFAVAHEYGHHIKEHGIVESEGFSDEERLVKLQRQEVEADTIGLMLSIKVGLAEGERNNFAFSGVGAISTLSALDMVKRATKILETGTEEDQKEETHPALDIRLDALERFHEIADGEAYFSLRDERESFRKIYKLIWQELSPIFVSLYEKGYLSVQTDQQGWLP